MRYCYAPVPAVAFFGTPALSLENSSSVAAPSIPPSRPASRTSVDVLLGSVVDGDFEIVRVAGSGSHADVYQARQKSVGQRTVALKVLSRLYLNLKEPDFRRAGQALLREGEILGSLHAACFVDVYRTGMTPDGRPYIALEFAEGRTLATILADGRRPATSWLLDVLYQWALGLAELHARGWVHRDVTPANAVVTEGVFGDPKLMIYDFGTVTQISSTADRFRTGFDRDRPGGTAAYMSPEQAAGGVVDGRSDQFALAAIAYEMLTGTRPVQVEVQGTAAHLDYLRGSGPVPMRPLTALRPDLPAAMGAVLAKALARSPEQRFADVLAFFHAFEEAGQGAPEKAPASGGLLSRLLGRGGPASKGSK